MHGFEYSQKTFFSCIGINITKLGKLILNPHTHPIDHTGSLYDLLDELITSLRPFFPLLKLNIGEITPSTFFGTFSNMNENIRGAIVNHSVVV